MKSAKYLFFNAILLLMITGIIPGQALAAPKATFPEPAHNFGTLPDSGIHNHTFTVQNTGDEELVLERIITDCGCATTESDKVIAPGQQGTITVSFNSGGYQDVTVKRKIRVYTNDPENDPAVLTISAFVEAPVNITPQRVSFTGVPGEPMSRTVTITPSERYPLKIVSAEARFGQNIRLEFKEDLTGDEPVYYVTIYNTRETSGKYVDTIILKTDNAEVPEVSIRVNGTILTIN